VAAHLIPILRLLVLVGWSMVTLWAAPAYRRAVLGVAADGDYKQVALAIVGFALVWFQVNAFGLPPRTDYGTAAGLTLLAVGAGIVFVFVHLPLTPDDHKRGLALTYLAILVACVIGGSLG
jgi:hypothetical protein